MPRLITLRLSARQPAKFTGRVEPETYAAFSSLANRLGMSVNMALDEAMRLWLETAADQAQPNGAGQHGSKP